MSYFPSAQRETTGRLFLELGSRLGVPSTTLAKGADTIGGAGKRISNMQLKRRCLTLPPPPGGWGGQRTTCEADHSPKRSTPSFSCPRGQPNLLFPPPFVAAAPATFLAFLDSPLASRGASMMVLARLNLAPVRLEPACVHLL